MIQRIQSVYFLLAALFSSAGFFLPVYRVIGVAPHTDPILFPKSVIPYTLADTEVLGMPVAIAYAVAVIVPLLAIFLYKNRPVQMRLGRIGILAATAALALLVIRYGDAGKTAEVVPALGMFIPVGSIIFSLLAVRAVKKDDELVRSSDRIR